MKSTHKKLTEKLDKICSELTKIAWGNKCALCGKPGNLAAHHFFTKKAHGGIRFEVDQLILLCFACHIYKVHSRGETEEVRDKLIEKIGQKRFDELKVLAYQVRKFKDSELKELLEVMKERLENEST